MPIIPSKTRLGLILLVLTILAIIALFYYNAALGAEPVMTYVGARNLNNFSTSSPKEEVETRTIKEVRAFDSMNRTNPASASSVKAIYSEETIQL